MTKKCFKCKKVKDINLFYKHKQMGDGHLNKCITCAKKDVRRRYYDPESRQRIIQYEFERFKNPQRKEKVRGYAQKMRAKNPGKFKARNKVSNALRSGKLKRQPCSECGDERSQAHHTDYRKPLQVKWLCRKHHMLEENKRPF